jgi:hypothetical protein
MVVALKAWAEANLQVIEKSNVSFDRTVNAESIGVVSRLK